MDNISYLWNAKMNLTKFYNFSNIGDIRGSLVSIDSSSGIPFEIKRVYFIHDTKPNISRGKHAHKKLHQVAFCISGSCIMSLDDGRHKEEVILNSPNAGIDIPPMLWHEMYNFTNDCILLVLANDYYDENDYIRDYEEFKKMIGVS